MSPIAVVLNAALVALLVGDSLSAPSRTVHCPWGLIQGVVQTASTGRNYVTYLNIPYAKPPVGNLRFRLPVPMTGPPGVYQTTTKFGNMCPQEPIPKSVSRLTLPPQSEDCLTLNVFTPEKALPKPNAVMVWIHGGAWVGGAANFFDMWKIVTEANVIGVSIQYRLGALGFLSTGSTVIPGNYAMMDQVLALKWVKDNIASFGGDVGNITIYGESAGGGSVGFLTLSPLSKNLFSRAIMQSGTAIGYWGTRTDAKKYAHKLAMNVNCSEPATTVGRSDADLQLLTCLRTRSFRELVDNSEFERSMTDFSADLIWSPVVDHHFLVRAPEALIEDTAFLASIGFYDVDIMLGVNNAEGGYTLGMARQYGAKHSISGIDVISSHSFLVDEFLPTMLSRVYGKAPQQEIDVIAFESLDYKANQPPYPNLNQTASAVLGLVRDITFLVPAVRTARAHAAHSRRGATYLYYFDHYPTFTSRSLNTGMNHATDIGYSFGLSENYIHLQYHTTGPIDQAEYDLSNTFVQILADFVKFGNPNEAVKNKLSAPWLDYADNESYLSLSTNMAVKDHIRRKEVALWLQLIPKLNEDLRHPDNVSPNNHVPVVG